MTVDLKTLCAAAVELETQACAVSKANTMEGAWIGSSDSRRHFFKLGRMAREIRAAVAALGGSNAQRKAQART